MKLSHILVAALFGTSLSLSAGTDVKVKKYATKSKVRTEKQVKPRITAKAALPGAGPAIVKKTQNYCPACGRG